MLQARREMHVPRVKDIARHSDVQSNHVYIAVRVRVHRPERLANMPCPDEA
jgi:hypothetical protein